MSRYLCNPDGLLSRHLEVEEPVRAKADMLTHVGRRLKPPEGPNLLVFYLRRWPVILVDVRDLHIALRDGSCHASMSLHWDGY